MKKSFLNDACIIAKSRGGICISTEYKNAKTPLMWRCSKNHTWTALLRKVKYEGSWCPYCAGHVRLALEDSIQIAVSKHGQCLSTEYVNSKIPMLWKCHQDHIWSTPFKNIKYLGTWCPHCAGMPFQTKMMHIELCLSKSFINSVMPLQWRCAKNHEWTANLIHIKNGHWCPYCAGNARSKLQWRCAKGHEWFASFAKIKNSRSWCPECSHRKPYTLEYVKQYAYNKNGKCLSEKYINCEIPLRWCCTKGHEWTARFNNIKNGFTWCPYCSKYKREELCREIVSKYLGPPSEDRWPDFLKTSEHPSGLQLDIPCYDYARAGLTQERIMRRTLDCFKVCLVLRGPIYSYSRTSSRIGSH
ncbi:hypothetical protein Glove_319g25 [Diversispora epigaea]|uniref:Zinc-ribbon domain-containing protein n=1 Tax=Diversispora epigaea TaxID=1348612 RepID=A0A397HPJ2_9GLOM|nr:hypothetical protein Glove_319g25 [Diversispora epigaea]